MTTSEQLSLQDQFAYTKLYRAVWRWHFYSGLFVIPFLLMLALTGGFMMIYSDISNELGFVPNVSVAGQPLAVSEQATKALTAVPDGRLLTYISPEAPNRPAFFEVSKGDATIAVAVDPFNGNILNSQVEGSTWRAYAEKIHGKFLLGTFGDRLIETAASLSIVMVITGLFMWWPRGEGLARAIIPRFSNKDRRLWKDLHATAGFWISAVLVLFMLSGLAWSGIWGESYVQPWSSFPASKWDNVPLSDLTHASMNHDSLHHVPWPLEKTPMPASGSQAGAAAVPQPVVLDTVVQWATENGFSGQYKLAVPANEKGVYSVSLDGRNEDGVAPWNDRFVHIDQYTGNILADVRYADYKPVGKLMALGVGLHKGMVGRANFVFNLIYLALVVFVCVSGIVMWWKRRPEGQLASPLYPRNFAIPKFILGIGAFLAVCFPMGGVAITVFAVVDFLLPKRLKEAGLERA